MSAPAKVFVLLEGLAEESRVLGVYLSREGAEAEIDRRQNTNPDGTRRPDPAPVVRDEGFGDYFHLWRIEEHEVQP